MTIFNMYGDVQVMLDSKALHMRRGENRCRVLKDCDPHRMFGYVGATEPQREHILRLLRHAGWKIDGDPPPEEEKP